MMLPISHLVTVLDYWYTTLDIGHQWVNHITLLCLGSSVIL